MATLCVLISCLPQACFVYDIKFTIERENSIRNFLVDIYPIALFWTTVTPLLLSGRLLSYYLSQTTFTPLAFLDYIYPITSFWRTFIPLPFSTTLIPLPFLDDIYPFTFSERYLSYYVFLDDIYPVNFFGHLSHYRFLDDFYSVTFFGRHLFHYFYVFILSECNNTQL